MARTPKHSPLHGDSYEVEALVQQAVDLAFRRLMLDRPVLADSVDQLVDLLDSGLLDPVLERHSPPIAGDLPVRRYADSTPFSYEDWKRRHGMED